MKINNEFLVNTFFNNSKNIKNDEVFSQALEGEIVKANEKDLITAEIGNGDTFLKITKDNNIFNGGGWAYIDKYGFSHVVSDYKTAAEFKKPQTSIYSYNGKFGGGYALDEENNRLRVPIPGEKPYDNDKDELEKKRALIADSKYIGEEVSYLRYLEIISNIKNKVGI